MIVRLDTDILVYALSMRRTNGNNDAGGDNERNSTV